VDIALDLVGVAPFTVSWEIEDLETNTITPQAALVGINDGYLLNVCPANTSIIRITGVSDSFNPVCTNTAVTGFEIEVDELSTASLQQDVSICEGSSGEIGIVFSNPTAGPWEISMSDNLGNTYNLPAITPADLNQGVYYYTITPQGPLTLEITAFTDGSLPCTAFSGEVFVLIEPVPFATIAQDAVLCPGSTVGLTVGLPAGGSFDVVYNDGVNDFTLAGISDGFVFDVEPLANTTYTLVSVTELDGALNCTSSVIDESATISVVDAPLPSAIDTLCDDTGENFQVVFELNGGDPLTYSVTALGAGQGSLSAAPPYVYTSAVIPSGSTVSFEIEDGNPCTPYILEMDVIECPVLTDAGTMDNSLIEVCNGEAAIAVWNNDGFLDGNDELMYVLHDSPGASLGLVYEIDCNDAGFNDGDTPLDFGNGIGEIAFGVTYYISAVAGNDDGTNDCVNLNHPDISVAPGTPVVFYQTPSAFLSGGGVICEGETAQLQVDFTGIGPWDFEVALAGVGQGVISTNTNPFVFEVENPGVYTLVSLQNAICSGLYNGQANLLVNPLPTATILSGGEICEGDDFNLEIALTGTAPWEIQLAYDDGNTELTELLNAVASPFFHPVAEEGLYFIVQVIDGNNCNNQVEGTSVELLVNGLPEAVMLNNDVETCDNEGIDLSFELIGEAPWLIEYSINGIIQDAVEIAQSPFTLFTDIPGTYVLESVSDGNNCFGSVTGSFEYTSTPSPVANAGPDLQVCSGIDVLIGTPALPGLVYSWVDPQDNLNTINQAQAVFTAINNGVNSVAYTVTLTVSDGLCSDTSSVSINVLNSPPANAGPDIQTCLNEPVQLNASGGVACVWEANPALDDSSVCNPTANPLVNTEFVVEVEGANGCFKSDTVLVEVGDPIVLQALAYSTEVCFNTCDGIIDLQAQGGFGNYSFEWTFPDGTTAFGSEINDLCSGDYLVTVTDINGCSSSDAFFIAELPEYDFQQVSATAAVCFGESNGIIEVVSSEAISFAIDNGPALAPNIPDGYLFAGLGEGTYTISAVNDIGCVATDQIQIDEYSQINLFPSFDEQQACFQEEITFSAFANGGGGIFTYFWIDENNALLGNGTTLELIMEAPTVITVYAEDQNGCLSDEYEMEVFFGSPITADIFPDPDAVTSICEGDQITISANLGGGLGFIAPQWVSLSSGQIISNQSSFTISPDEDDFYVLTAVDGCSQPLVDTVQVVVMETPAVEIGFDVISGCAPLQVQLVNLTNELLVDQCLWDFGDGNVLAACIDTISYLYVNPGTYTVSLTVTSSQGCISSSDMQADIVVHAYPLADFTWEPNPPSNLENIVQIVNQSTGASNYLWDFGNLGQSGLPNPLVELPAVDYGVFPACLTAISPYGCIDTICREIVLEGEFLLWVPNAFTPDGDGRNEVFQPIVAGANPNEYSFRIFDRWGQLVFETTKLDEPWSGNFSGGSYYVQNDVYVWQIICEELISGNRREFTGHVTIIR
jgi:gliding motility-associated-like protein